MHTLLLVGCGKMGNALLQRWKHSFVQTSFHIIDPHHADVNEPNLIWHKNLGSLPKECSPTVIVFAIKPQQMDEMLPYYREHFSQHAPLYLSIAAGKTLSYYQTNLGEHAHIVRAMPNTPALVGKGMTALCASANLPAIQKKIATDLMNAVGKVEWIDDELLMDAVTAISGCGPAYLFLFLESLTAAGVAAGLSEATAKILAVETIDGSLHLTGHSGKSYEQLRIDVASPGGATQAALDILMKNNAMKSLLEQAVLAAKQRSKELSK
jgi:pyrroline-5-carboxylate reductase